MSHGGAADLERIEALATEVVEGHGLLIYDIELVGQRGRTVLRVTVDRPGGREPGQGVTIEECVDISRELGQLLDVEEPVAGEYDLEVGSPGVERPLKGVRQFRLALGEKVHLFLSEEAEGPREVVGQLEGFDEESGMLDVRLPPPPKKLKKGQIPRPVPVETWQKVEVKLSQVRKARTRYEF